MTEKAIAIIPARYGSTRFPGKVLMHKTGQPLVQHVVDQVKHCHHIAHILVATDDERIAESLKPFDTQVVMTGEHPNGTSRLAEVADRFSELNLAAYNRSDALIINVQGDEPEIAPRQIDQLIERMNREADKTEEGGHMAQMGSLACPLLKPGTATTADDEVAVNNPNVVKVVMDQQGYALYFSRSRIPHSRDNDKNILAPIYQHVGLYAYRLGFLETYVNLATTPLEQEEKLEQLRVLEHGYKIAMTVGQHAHPGIDTEVQYDAFVTRWLEANRR